MLTTVLRLLPSDGSDDGVVRPFGPAPAPARRGDLAYSIETWTDAAGRVEAILAMAATPGTAWAAYYASVRDHPERIVALRHNGQLLASTLRH
ncbi:MAG: hypothetical protein ACM30I_14445 [Gemmatimonas sp.]